MLLTSVQLLAMVVLGVAAREISDEEHAQLPRLYHLDDFDSCLAKTDGLYCLGTFNIEPPKQYDPNYEFIREYSADPFHFNRTRLHRGYCVSARCPSAERNASRRFQRCAALFGRRRRLRLTLDKLTYCRTHAQEYARKHNPEPLDLPQRILLLVTAVLGIANFVGTTYDVTAGDDKKRNSLLSVWSIRSNWQRLTATYEDGDPRLTALMPLQGVRVFLMFLVMSTHAACIHDMLYLHNPHFVERVARTAPLMIFMNGTSVVMIFVLISSFLLSYNLLIFSKSRQLKMGMLKWCILKRIARMSPISLLVVGYAATFWPHVTDGPMWPTLVEPESTICREKFWAQAFYINNLWRPNDHCLVQTWFLATDMQLYILACILTIWLAPKRLVALPILAALVLASCTLNGGLAYYFDWQSIMYHVYPETMHTMYHDVPSFYRLYISPWGSAPACLVGLLLAHVHFELQERGIKITSYRTFRWAYGATPVAIVWWLVAGHWVRRAAAAELTALYAAAERPVLSALAALLVLGLINGMHGFLKNYFAWSGWHAMGRMSLSVLMIHWLVNTVIAASRAQPIETSLLAVTVDSIATTSLSYVLSIPLTIMVEMPMSRFINTLMFASKQNEQIQQETTLQQGNKVQQEIKHQEENILQQTILPSEAILTQNISQEDKGMENESMQNKSSKDNIIMSQEIFAEKENRIHKEKTIQQEKRPVPQLFKSNQYIDTMKQESLLSQTRELLKYIKNELDNQEKTVQKNGSLQITAQQEETMKKETCPQQNIEQIEERGDKGIHQNQLLLEKNFVPLQISQDENHMQHLKDQLEQVPPHEQTQPVKAVRRRKLLQQEKNKHNDSQQNKIIQEPTIQDKISPIKIQIKHSFLNLQRLWIKS